MAQAADSYKDARKNLKSTEKEHEQSGVIFTLKKQKTRKCAKCEKEIKTGEPYFTESNDKNAPGYCQACVNEMQKK